VLAKVAAENGLIIIVNTDGDACPYIAPSLSVDAMPMTRASTLQTQTAVFENESIMLAGYLRDIEESAGWGIPYLRDIPWIGWLFGGASVRKETVQRMFVFTPHIVDLDAEMLARLQATRLRDITEEEKMEDDAVYVADVGQNQLWSADNYVMKNGRFLTTGGMGTMGYSVPAAVGAKMADPKRPTVAICGDGAFQMSMMELATAVQHNVDIKIVIMTNNRLGMVRELQTNGYDDRQTAVFLDGSPDFIKLAKAYGIDALRVDAKGDIDKAIDMIVNHKGICLVEVVVDDMFPSR
jgi:hypothetical protein